MEKCTKLHVEDFHLIQPYREGRASKMCHCQRYWLHHDPTSGGRRRIIRPTRLSWFAYPNERSDEYREISLMDEHHSLDECGTRKDFDPIIR